MFIPRICWLWICWHASREISEFFSICGSYQAKITQVIFHHTGQLFMFEILFTLVFTCLFSWYFKIVWPKVCFSLLSMCKVSRKCRRKNVIAAYRKRELSQKPNLCLWGAWKFPPKNIRTKQMPRLFIYILIKILKRYVARFFKRFP